MGKKNYAIAYLYGYGKYAYNSGGYGSPYYSFDCNSSIYFHDLNSYIPVEPAFQKIQITQNNSSGYYSHKVNVPLYLVEEDGIWREYFTGTTIKFYDFSSKGNNGIIRELVFGNSSGGTLTYTEPKNFANEISKYSKEQIRDMANQFLRLCNDAVAWSRSYDRVPEKHRQMELKKEQENILASEALERGIGQYSNFSLANKNSQAKTGGCLTQILMVLMLILSIWWILQ
ncbi:hypothetical protein [Candidatus Merdisoma sp. JLR.KK006]|uniref:hypothetical protein n=1 Tax=Candidatus Merdisoma sp. JLR.KK006 TaxID=3112626 RepID=UPI002FF371EB